MALLLPLTLFFHMILLAAAGGQWKLLQNNLGIVAMHMQLMHNDRVVIFDRTDFGFSNVTLPHGICRRVRHNQTNLTIDCTAHSVEYDVASNTYRPLFVQTDVWCSSGSVEPHGTLIQTGGFGNGIRKARIFKACYTPTCDWEEVGNALAAPRWYSTNHILPDGRQIIVGGRNQFNYEYFPKGSESESQGSYTLAFLVETTDPKRVENNLYPFVFLNVDGNLFIFANNRSILFDYKKNKVVRTYPDIPGGDPRCYPSTGSAVLLPLNLKNNSTVEAEVLICGGAPKGSFQRRNRGGGPFLPALDTCGRIKITDPHPQWHMETMPQGRVMNDMIILPNAHVLIINGAHTGTAGWENGRNPALNPYLYNPVGVGSRFQILKPSKIPRMYHSTAILLRDGRILVGGSNAHSGYVFDKVEFPTELRLEAYSPPYLEPSFSHLRPIIVAPGFPMNVGYSGSFRLRFYVTASLIPNLVSVTMLAPPFNTHSFSMNQRMLVLPTKQLMNINDEESTYQVEVMTPASPILAPPGFYLLFVLHQEIPSEGIWLHIQ
ncbi:aldehyde oxidase GLOX-like [Senna tora]|uniref:Aldehyde oxidase GLOX-like n=1 Tax=Senna tora TaxID=362788 RepID=A0A834U0T5_9FABA|nr:aldehyde oxidase GLOX-like [Senna tora]